MEDRDNMKKYIYILFFVLLIPFASEAGGGLKKALVTSSAAMKAQSERIKVISENIANSETTGLTSAADPYRRKTIFFENVKDDESGANVLQVKKIERDKSDFKMIYRPEHPAANADGYVKYPNVDRNLESIDIREAQKSYEANVTAIEVTKQMMERSLDLMR